MKDAPDHLSAEGRALWAEITGKYELRADELVVLTHACGAADMAAEFYKVWSDMGRPMTSRNYANQDVEHPLIGSIDKQRKASAAFLKQLKLPDEAGAEKANQQRSAAQSRWAAHGKGA